MYVRACVCACVRMMEFKRKLTNYKWTAYLQITYMDALTIPYSSFVKHPRQFVK